MEDSQLVARFQRGDESAFDELVERHRRRIYSLVCRLANPGEADDLAQDVFIAAYKALPNFRGDSAFSTWLYRIAVHVCSHHLRKRRLDTTDLDEQQQDFERGHDPERSAISTELQERVRAAIDQLPYKLRLVVVLRDMQGLNYEEIAQVVGCPIGTVRSRLHYATQRLASALQPYVEVG
ncbi:MAG TPA: sigma-70 family RNA polymerase sigma factor [Armatimonadota bacterium]|nr:sigma-70 family RNA polymerase sigma factor [Armatimonadota bacterium]